MIIRGVKIEKIVTTEPEMKKMSSKLEARPKYLIMVTKTPTPTMTPRFMPSEPRAYALP